MQALRKGRGIAQPQPRRGQRRAARGQHAGLRALLADAAAAGLLRAVPQLKLELVLAPTAPDLFDQQIDLSFQSGAIPIPRCIAKRVRRGRWRRLRRTILLERFGTPRTPDGLAQHRCLNFLPGWYPQQRPLKDGGTVRSISPTGPVAASNANMLVSLAQSGLGLARLMRRRVQRDAHPAASPC